MKLYNERDYNKKEKEVCGDVEKTED